MKIYVVSSSKRILCNTGFITSTHTTWEAAFQVATVGQYIHDIYVRDVQEIVNVGKMAVRVDGSTEQK